MRSDLPFSQGADSVLVLVLHAWRNTPEDMRHVVSAVRRCRNGSHIIVPQLPLGGWSFADPDEIAAAVVDVVDRQVHFREEQGFPPFEDIILIGHSTGALIARKVYVLAGPESDEARFEGVEGPLRSARPWFPQVRRIILFAGMNRGWQLTHHLHPARFVASWIASFFADTLMAFTEDRVQLVIMNSRRGAPFLTGLRLQWLALMKRSKRDEFPMALTVQMLGSIDDTVAPADNVDLATGSDFAYLDVPYSGHGSVIAMDSTPNGQGRREAFRKALCRPPQELKRPHVVLQNAVEANNSVTDVIFVMHGIRDTGYWTQKIAGKVEEMGVPPPKMYASETSTYGYFGMLPFLLPSKRRAKVQWLMDQYVEARSMYPNARFSYVGHSNGTYLAAQALEQYPSCRFDRLVFAGSVVRTRYPWARMLANGQAGAVLNYVATHDWIVAVLPGAWEQARLQNLGSAGHNGFQDQHANLIQVKYIPGGHSCAIEESRWNEIARFLISPTPSQPHSDKNVVKQKRWAEWAGYLAIPIWKWIIDVLCGVGIGLYFIFDRWLPYEWPHLLWLHHPVIAVLVYLRLLVFILLKY